MFRLPEDQREFLRKPFGILYPNLANVLPDIAGHSVYTVGDVVTLRLLRHGITPQVAIIDKRTMRMPCERTPEYHAHRLIAHNPPGFITNELTKTIKDALSQTPAIIVVNGEEDLAVIPLVLAAPNGGIVLYGQPGAGVVLREINPEAKKEAKRILSHFIKED